MAVEVISGETIDFPAVFEESSREIEKEGRIITCVERNLGRGVYLSDRQRYFDTRELSLRFKDQRMSVEAYIWGPGRKENISLLVDQSVKPEISDPGVMNLGRTFQPANMYVLEALSRSENPPQDGEYSVGVIRQNDGAGKKVESEEHVKRVFTDALSQETLPSQIVGRLLTNDQHWQLVILDLSQGVENPRLMIVNTTHMIRKGNIDLSRIQEIYFGVIGKTINSVLVEAGGRAIPQEEIIYIQGLQYGNMGCGITTDLNYRTLVRKEFTDENVTRASDFIKTEGFEEVKMGDETFRFPKTEIQLVTDRSARTSRLDESFRRMQLFGELYKREQLAKEICAASAAEEQ